ncbi:MAG: ABC transporter permease [Planctomycetota bacterium]
MTYAEIVRTQFAKHRDAVWCVRILVVLFLAATYAPIVALDVPFWTDLESAAAFPWLKSLFDPTVFPLNVDVFFNLLMATLPLLVVAWFFTRGRKRRRVLAGWVVLHVVLFIALLYVREEWRSPVRDYPMEVHEAEASAVWPLVRHHPGRRMSEFSLSKPFRDGTMLKGAEPPPKEIWPFFLLGSDNLGNDVFTRLLYGTRISLTIGVIAVSIYVLIGVVLGALAGYFGGWVDDLLMFLAQVVMVIPYLFLILFILSVVEKATIFHVMGVIALVGWPTVMRLVRGEFLRQREIDYVMAAKALGMGNDRVIFRHVVPNTLAPVFVSATFGVAAAILIESTLAFLGLGDPAAPSWGQLLRIGYENKDSGRHLIWAGGLAIFAMVLMINIIGEGLRDALDPKLRR